LSDTVATDTDTTQQRKTMSDIPTEIGEKMAKDVRASDHTPRSQKCPQCASEDVAQIDGNKAGSLYECNDCGADYIV